MRLRAHGRLHGAATPRPGCRFYNGMSEARRGRMQHAGRSMVRRTQAQHQTAQRFTVQTGAAAYTVLVTRKRVKNLNLRVRGDGSVGGERAAQGLGCAHPGVPRRPRALDRRARRAPARRVRARRGRARPRFLKRFPCGVPPCPRESSSAASRAQALGKPPAGRPRPTARPSNAFSPTAIAARSSAPCPPSSHPSRGAWASTPPAGRCAA